MCCLATGAEGLSVQKKERETKGLVPPVFDGALGALICIFRILSASPFFRFCVRRAQTVVKTGQMSTRHFTSSQRRVESQLMATSPRPAGMRRNSKVVTFGPFGPLAFALVHCRHKSHPRANQFGSTITELIDSGTKQV